MQLIFNLKVQLFPTEQQAQCFQECTSEYQRLCDIVSDWFYYKHHLKASRKEFNSEMYYRLREISPTINSAMIQLTYLSVARQYHQANQVFKQKACTEPLTKILKWPLSFQDSPLDYAYRCTCSFIKKNSLISMSVLNKCITMPSSIEQDLELLNAITHFGNGQLVSIIDKWFLVIPITVDKEKLPKGSDFSPAADAMP